MIAQNLVEQLRAECNGAPAGDKVVRITLFGIQHSNLLQGVNVHDLAERAGIGRASGTELRKGIRLADYVQLKQQG